MAGRNEITGRRLLQAALLAALAAAAAGCRGAGPAPVFPGAPVVL